MLATAPSTNPALLAMLGLPDNAAAWTTFVATYRPLIERHARAAGLPAHDADDITARVLAALVKALPAMRYDPALSLRGYLRTAVRNAVRQRGRTRARRPGDFASGCDADRDRLHDLPADPVPGLGDAIEADLHARMAVVRRVTDAVRAKVDARTWDAYRLAALDGLPAADVAGQLGMTVGAVYQAKFRVGKLLRAEGDRLRSEGGAAP